MSKNLTTAAGAPVVDNQNTMTAGPRGPALLQDIWLLEDGRWWLYQGL